MSCLQIGQPPFVLLRLGVADQWSVTTDHPLHLVGQSLEKPRGYCGEWDTLNHNPLPYRGLRQSDFDCILMKILNLFEVCFHLMPEI